MIWQKNSPNIFSLHELKSSVYFLALLSLNFFAQAFLNIKLLTCTTIQHTFNTPVAFYKCLCLDDCIELVLAILSFFTSQIFRNIETLKLLFLIISRDFCYPIIKVHVRIQTKLMLYMVQIVFIVV